MKNFYAISNHIFDLRLDSYELHIYSYLVCRAGKRGECWPSIATIARQTGVSENTVIKKIDSLVSKRLIDKRTTSQKTPSGKVRQANNHYYIRPFEEAYEHYFDFGSGVKSD